MNIIIHKFEHVHKLGVSKDGVRQSILPKNVHTSSLPDCSCYTHVQKHSYTQLLGLYSLGTSSNSLIYVSSSFFGWIILVIFMVICSHLSMIKAEKKKHVPRCCPNSQSSISKLSWVWSKITNHNIWWSHHLL